MNKKVLLIATLSMLIITGCVSRKLSALMKSDQELAYFASLLTGKFSNAKQAAEDTAYFHISLVMTPIWPERTDGYWLYVEQAVVSNADKPYRQRVYRLTRPLKNVFQSDIYSLQNATEYAGAQNDPEKMKKLTFDRIELKDGCSVTLVRKKDVYTGGTTGEQCLSDLRGAKYATSKITLKEGELISWDQGFDASGKQVWGATKGGYIFIRKE